MESSKSRARAGLPLGSPVLGPPLPYNFLYGASPPSGKGGVGVLRGGAPRRPRQWPALICSRKGSWGDSFFFQGWDGEAEAVDFKSLFKGKKPSKGKKPDLVLTESVDREDEREHSIEDLIVLERFEDAESRLK
jgi:hypothetical protein